MPVAEPVRVFAYTANPVLVDNTAAFRMEKIMKRLAYAALALSFVACRGSGGGDDTPDPDAPVGGDVTIQEVQSDAMPSGTPIELNGVVVTAIDNFGDRTGDFSGVKVFGAPLDQVAALQPGDLVNITGAIKHEACNEAAPCGPVVFENGASITEVIGASQGSLVVTRVGTGTLPPPTMVDAKAIAALPTAQERDAEWEKYEGVLVTVINARQLGPVDTFGSNPGEDSNEFRITSFARVQSVLTELPATALVGTCYQSITGVTDFFFNYIIAPRSEADLVAGGTGCNPLAESINAVQTATTIPELAILTDVVVTAIDNIGDTSKGFWVQDAAQGAEHNGVFVFLRDQAIPAFVTVGARVNVIGSVDEFDLGTPEVGDKITEIINPVVTDSALPDVTPVPAVVAVNILSDIGAAGEPWEGVLVRANQVKVTNDNLGNGKVELRDNNNNILIMDDESFRPADADVDVNDCFDVTGVMHVQVIDNIRTINPRSLTDLAPTTGCN
jgi:hypothetical protein